MPCVVSLLSTPVKPYTALEASISDLRREEITEELTDHRGQGVPKVKVHDTIIC